MKKLLTNLSKSLALIGVLALFMTAVESNAAVKNVLIEEQTGTWCPYCPDGAAILQGIINKYPGRVIGVAWHNRSSDPMTLPEQSQFAQYYGVSGYPNAVIDRRPWGGKYSHNRGVWENYAVQCMQLTAECEVKSYYIVDEASRNIEIYVEAHYDTQTSGDMRFNAYILENGIVYPQAGAGNDYVHNHVLRKLMGGIWGTESIIPSTVNAGDVIKHKYTFKIPSAWDINNLHVVGIVQRYGADRADREIINSAEATHGIPTIETTMAQPTAKVISQGSTFSKEISITNTTDKQLTVGFTTELSGRTPDGWTAEVNAGSSIKKVTKDNILESEITIGANETKAVTFELIPSENLGIGDALVVIEDMSNDDAAKNAYVISAISKEIESFEILFDGETAYNVNTSVRNSGRDQYFPITMDDYIAFDEELDNVKYLIISGGNRGMLSTSGCTFFANKLNDGVGLLIEGGVTALYPYLQQQQNNLFNAMGIKWESGHTLEQYNSADAKFQLNGVSMDPITNGMSFSNCAIVPGGYLMEPIQITNTSVANKILTIDGKTMGARSETANARAVALQFNPYVIATDAQRKVLIDACLDWIEQAPSAGPQIAADHNSLDFGKTGIGKNKEMKITISNTGGEDLIISKAEVEYSYSHIFILQENVQNLTIPAGGSEEFTVSFEPKDKIEYESYITFKSNASNESELTIPLSGEGEEVGSVKDGVSSNGMLSMSVTPNPVSEKSTVRCSIAGMDSKNIDIYLVNAAGAKVADIFSGTRNSGEFTAQINAAGIPSGTYYLILNADGSMIDLPVVIAK